MVVENQPRPCVHDTTLSSDEKLWRRIQPNQLKNENGAIRPSSAAFRDKTDEVSVHLASLTTRAAALHGYDGFSLAELTIAFVRDLDLNVVRDPLPNDPSHAFVCPCPTGGKAKKMAREAVLIVIGEAPLQ